MHSNVTRILLKNEIENMGGMKIIFCKAVLIGGWKLFELFISGCGVVFFLGGGGGGGGGVFFFFFFCSVLVSFKRPVWYFKNTSFES